MAAGVVYLRTNRFEVKLQGITFKKKIFESLCKIDFLFPDGKTWDQPPVVGLDVMCHPRDPSIILLLLSFGVGCVILRFGAGESLPAPIHRFLADKRIRFVGFGIPEKTELFPFNELGLSKRQMDIGYIASRVYKDPKYKRYELGDLARKVVGIKRMIGLTESASFERHAQIKCAICQLFVTSLIAMGMLRKKRVESPSKKPSFVKNLNSLQLLAEGWFKLPSSKRIQPDVVEDDADAEIRARMEDLLDTKHREDPFSDYFADVNDGDDDSPTYSSGGDNEKGGNSGDDESSSGGGTKKPIKGILKCPSTTLNRSESCRSPVGTLSPSPPSQKLKRANSKGCNVRFKFQ
ncbi:hypothetical protein AAHA92_10516 [Salvia divinorum]|uniref:Uncharacterized protein n=1 Tax=Salvia divinorum TaxID=28513 RepID=A0ABD1HYF3_SALDI